MRALYNGPMALSVYVHVPFCDSRCRYCAFYSGEPLAALAAHPHLLGVEAALRRAAWAGPVQTLYLGGGTPSLLGPRGVAGVVRAVDRTWGLATGAEVTLEGNPGAPLDLAGLRAAGVNRLSLGLQCLDDGLLRQLGRRHAAAEALAALEAAAAAFDRVSADLLLGLPGLGQGALAGWLSQLAAVGVGHVSTYSLEVHAGTSLAQDVAAGAFLLPDAAEEERQWVEADAALTASGLAAYEVSNYARPGHECRHNLAYWEGAPYLGLGPGAHSFAPEGATWGLRSWNAPGLAGYRAALGSGALPPGGDERLTAAESLLETLFLALRRPAPADLLGLAARRGMPTEGFAARVAAAEREGLLARVGARWAPTRAGLRRADGLASWLFDASAAPLLP